jgi:hypothetical protein
MELVKSYPHSQRRKQFQEEKNNDNYYNNKLSRGPCRPAHPSIYFRQDFFTNDIWYDSYISLEEDEQLDRKKIF